MRNILVDALPTAIEIDGETHEINHGWKNCLTIILAFEDPELAVAEKQMVMLDLLYKERPEDTEQAFTKGIRFLNGGIEDLEDREDAPRIYSFEKDARLIMGAFQQTHQIDLETVEMHWWKFMALFMDLGKDTAFGSIVGLRNRIKTGRATKEERAVAQELGDIIYLPELDTRSIEESKMRREFFEAIAKGKEKKDG